MIEMLDKERKDRVSVSIFMSVYNGWPYIKEAVNSVLKQTCTDWEFIIVNDGSTDETSSYLDAIEDPRVKVIHQENRGLGKPLNRWMKQCRGEYIMRMDADDINALDRVGKQKEYLDSNRDIIMVGCQINKFTSSPTFGEASYLFTDHESIISGMKRGWHTMCHPTTMFRRSLLDKIDGYVITGAGEDWSLLMDAGRYGKLANLDEVLYHQRVHEGSSAWGNASKTIAGFEYARKRYAAAVKGQEYPLSQFNKEWNRKSLLSRLRLRAKALSIVTNRKAVIDRIEGRKVRAAFRTMVAASLSLNKARGALLKRIRAQIFKK